MNFSLALAAAGVALASANPFASARSAKSANVSNLLRTAKATSRSHLRGLGDDNEDKVDLSTYSIKFEKCQFVETSGETERFVIFRLCPNDSCGSCDSGYGEYLIDFDRYLDNMVGYHRGIHEATCRACGDRCDLESEKCSRTCEDIEFNFIDASEFLECQSIAQEGDQDAIYAGAVCAGDGSRMEIGIFRDANCNVVDSSDHIENYLGDGDGSLGKLWYGPLENIYSEDSCVSCLMIDGDNPGMGELTMCRKLYESSAKCEYLHGFDKERRGNSQAEKVECDLIESIRSGSYGAASPKGLSP